MECVRCGCAWLVDNDGPGDSVPEKTETRAARLARLGRCPDCGHWNKVRRSPPAVEEDG